jgi:hypothetical protein
VKKIINVLVRIAVTVAVFAFTVNAVNGFQNRNYKELNVEMEDAQLPLMYVESGELLINCMHGYTGDVDLTLLRDSITPIDDSKHIDVVVDDSKDIGKSFSYEIRSISGDSLIENGELDVSASDNGQKILGIDVRMDLKEDMEYMLVVKLSGEDGIQADYYTRIVVNDNYYEGQLLQEAMDFHDATFDYDAVQTESVITEFQSSYTGDSTTGLGHVDLGSSYSEITWNGLTPTIIGDVDKTIKEIDENYAVIELEYKILSTTDQDVESFYSVKEFYKVSCEALEDEDNVDESETSEAGQDSAGAAEGSQYLSEAAGASQDSTGETAGSQDYEGADISQDGISNLTVSVLSYDRYMDEYFDTQGIDSNKNVYEIGIVSSEDFQYSYTEDNKMIAFVRNGQLWLYDYANSRISMAFGFWMDDYDNKQNTYDNYGINIIDLKDEGDITFAVYGYMNRGVHEGKLGISLYEFDYENLELNEILFVECNVPYEAMSSETSRLTYYDGNSFYFMLGDKVNVVDIAKKQQSYIADNLSSRDFKVAADMSVLAYGESDVNSENTKITLMNLKEGTSYEIEASSGECLTCYGFKDSDMIYGVSNISDEDIKLSAESFKDTRYSEESRNLIPAKELYIVDSDGNTIKEYHKTDCYLVQVDIDTNLLYLTRGEKEDGKFVAIKDDFITFKEDDENPTVSTTHMSSITGYDRLYFTVPSNIYLSYVPKVNVAKLANDSKAVSIMTTIIRDRITYHVYDNLGLSKIYDVAGDAINYAVEVAGIVVSSQGEIVYRQKESQEFNTIAAGIFHHSSKSVDQSLLDCVYMVLTYEGVTVSETDIMQYDMPLEAMNELGKKEAIEVTGIDLSMSLGYVSNGVPVICRIDDGRYVLLVSYNSVDVRYYDPVLDEEVVVSREEYEKSMSLWSKEQYTYVEE